MNPDAAYFAAMKVGIPSLTTTPDPLAAHEAEHGITAGLDVIDMNNESVNEIAASVERAEETGELRRMDYRGEK